MKRPTIKLDIDGVLRDMLTSMIDLYNEEFGQALEYSDIKSYDLDVSFPLLRQHGIDPHKYFFEDHVAETIINAPTYIGVATATEDLHKYFDIHIVSYQPGRQAKVETLNWLVRNSITFDSITFTNSRTKEMAKTDIIIDDCPTFLSESDCSIKICISQPYNTSTHCDYRYRTLQDCVVELARMIDFALRLED